MSSSTSSHPFVPHYETRDEKKQAEQLRVILSLYHGYGKSKRATVGALVTLGWSENESQEAVTYAIKMYGV